MVANAFVLRNLEDLRAGLAEMARVLEPGGRLVCLELTHPPPGLFAPLYRLYFQHLMPHITGVLSGDPEAYRYLPHSLREFPTADALAGRLRELGFERVEHKRLSGGTVALHTGMRAA